MRDELLTKSREAALSAVQIFNNPLIRFKSESYIVLMVIAWTYLLHAHYRTIGVEYRYFDQKPKSRRYHKTKHGAFKYWELERCLNADECPVGEPVSANLRFLIGLRHEIEHQMTMNLDAYLSGRYQACALNYNACIKELFGGEWGIDKFLTYALQFLELTRAQAEGLPVNPAVPDRLTAYMAEFDGTLPDAALDSQEFSYRLHFKRRLVGKPGQADRVVEFIDPNSEEAQAMDRQLVMAREVERRKRSATEVVELIQGEGYPGFSLYHHTQLWQSLDAKNPGKGYGVQISTQFWWYERWLDVVRRHCANNAARFA